MLRKKRYVFLLCSCLYIGKGIAIAQDPHLSQYFSSPLTFNPSFTGSFEGTQRVAVNIRNQWADIGSAYTTGTVSFDTKILRKKIAMNDTWGFGVHALYDRSADGVFKNSYLSLSTAYNKGLDAEGDQSIGIGVQVSFAQNSVDFNRISFSNQFTGSGFDPSVPSGESIRNQSISYMDLNTGVLYNYKDVNGNQFSIGAALFHVLRPRLSYFTGSNAALPSRYTVHAGGSFPVNENDNFFVNAHLMKQSGADETVFGGGYGLGLGSSDIILNLGAWLRLGDAVYPYIGLQTPSYQLGFSYDITSSDLSRIKRFTGSTELSFIYFFNANPKRGIPCFF